MLKKTLTYTNLDGNLVTKDYYFQITKAEAAKMAASEGADYGERLRKLSAERDGAKIMAAFEDLLCSAVGEREDDMFIKDPLIAKRFRYGGAYDSLFEEILDLPDFGLSMIKAIFPSDVQKEIDKSMAEQGIPTVLPGTPEDRLEAMKGVLGSDRVEEIRSGGVIEGVAGDMAVQHDKPQPTFIHPGPPTLGTEPTVFPQNLDRAIQANASSEITDDDPAWLKEGRSPTRKELMKMSKEDMQLVYKMREAGLIK
jgi:hypothetical protein